MIFVLRNVFTEFGSYTSEAAAAHKQKQIYLCVNCENFNFNTRFCHLKFWTIIIIARMYHNRFFDQYFFYYLYIVYMMGYGSSNL